MNKLIDLTGKSFERLTVLRRGDNIKQPNGKEIPTWICRCECGNVVQVRGWLLRKGMQKSCGCIVNEVVQNKTDEKMNELWNLTIYDGTRINILTSKTRKDNKSGQRGVFWHNKRQQWIAYISLQGKRKHLGYFKDKEDAIKARRLAEERLWKPIIEEYEKENANV